MFGYVRANLNDLSEEEKTRYRAFYCGLCQSLGERHGQRGRMTLSFDMTFLPMFLGSLYEPEESTGEMRCVPHPARPHPFVRTEITDYAADMTVALAYYKCLDDWQDDRKPAAKAGADLLAGRYAVVKERWPVQTAMIEASLQELSEVEKSRDESPDAAAGAFGRLMGGLFVMKDDYWRGALRAFGTSLGRFIYLSDAACDYDKDKKSGSYNPVVLLGRTPEDMRGVLMQTLGAASAAFESMPMLRDEHILRNVLYSGVWQTYNESMEKRKDGEKRG